MMSLGLLGISQTPEQQKMMEEMEKNMAEAMRMQDSMMNTPDMKNLMGQIQAQEKIIRQSGRKKMPWSKNKKQKLLKIG